MTERHRTGLSTRDSELAFIERAGRFFLEMDGDAGFEREIPKALYEALVTEFGAEIKAERANDERYRLQNEEWERNRKPVIPMVYRNVFDGVEVFDTRVLTQVVEAQRQVGGERAGTVVFNFGGQGGQSPGAAGGQGAVMTVLVAKEMA